MYIFVYPKWKQTASYPPSWQILKRLLCQMCNCHNGRGNLFYWRCHNWQSSCLGLLFAEACSGPFQLLIEWAFCKSHTGELSRAWWHHHHLNEVFESGTRQISPQIIWFCLFRFVYFLLSWLKGDISGTSIWLSLLY